MKKIIKVLEQLEFIPSESNTNNYKYYFLDIDQDNTINIVLGLEQDKKMVRADLSKISLQTELPIIAPANISSEEMIKELLVSSLELQNHCPELVSKLNNLTL